MIRYLFLWFTLFSYSLMPAQADGPWANPSYSRGTLVIYAGAGALIRHIDKRHFEQATNYLLRSPVITLGADLAFGQTDEAWWGIGPYLSKTAGFISFQSAGKEIQHSWSSVVAAVKVSHHHKMFITKKIDLCSGGIVGVRGKFYHNDQLQFRDRRSFEAVVGITGTLKYYPRKSWGLYIEAALGYRVDPIQVGVCHRIK